MRSRRAWHPNSGWHAQRPMPHPRSVGDLRERVPGHSLIDELLQHAERGSIRAGERPGEVIVEDAVMTWYRGILGERYVASLLEELGEDWTILHSVPVGSRTTDIDHVAIGAAGVFTINTKYSPGATIWYANQILTVGPQRHPYIRTSIAEARRASTLLSRACGFTVPVTGFLAFVDPEKIIQKSPLTPRPGDPELYIVSDRQLPHALRGPAVFNSDQLARIAEAASLPSTWHSAPRPSTNPISITREFAALEDLLGDGWRPGSQSHAVISMTHAEEPHLSQAGHRTRPVRSHTVDSPRDGRQGRTRLDVLLRGVLIPLALIGGGIYWLTHL